MSEKTWSVYLSGEIHSDWRDRIARGVEAAGLPVRLSAPVTVHEDSDDCAAAIFGPQDNPFWHDHSSAKLNAVRTGTLIEAADVVVVRFGEKYKQWNAAFDAGYAVALGKPIIARDPAQVVQALAYVTRGELPR
jgi:YtoQ family protein